MTHDTKAAEPALPPLPEPRVSALNPLDKPSAYTANQMREYGRQCAALSASTQAPAVERDAPVPFTHAQLERLYLNSPAVQNVIGFAGFARIVRLAESAHRIANQAPGEPIHG